MVTLFTKTKPEEESTFEYTSQCGSLFSNIYKDKIVNIDDNTSVITKASTPRKTRKVKGNTDNETMQNSELQMHESNQPYADSYVETKNLLGSVIAQTDALQGEINEAISGIRVSKTLKNKYGYMSDLMSTSSSLISNKISAIKEMNKVTTDSHNLELKRIKDLKLNVVDKGDDNKAIMDMYNAFINMNPGSGQGAYQLPSIMSATLPAGTDNQMYGIGTSDHDGFIGGLTPTQQMIVYENNPNIETVVIFDAQTGNHYFSVIDTTTGQPAPNADVPDMMLLEDMTYDYANNIARNKNLDTKYRLIVQNSNISLY